MQSMSDVDLASQLHRERMTALAGVRRTQAQEQAAERRARRRQQRREVSRIAFLPKLRVRLGRGDPVTPAVAEPIPIRLGSVVLDCSDPAALAEFYRGLLGGEVGRHDEVTDLDVDGQLLSFHGVADYEYPQWPGNHPEYVRLDLAVSEFAGPHGLVTSMGAVPLDPVEPPPSEHGRAYRIYADPAGHPFSLYLG